MDFNESICKAMAKTMKHLNDFVFVSMANLILVKQDSYLSHLKSGIMPDTLAALRIAPLQMATLIPNNVLKIAEEDIAIFQSKGHSRSYHKKGHYHSCERQEKRQDNSKSDKPAWKNRYRIMWPRKETERVGKPLLFMTCQGSVVIYITIIV